MKHLALIAFLLLPLTHLSAGAPVIAHDPPASIPAGQYLKIVARVEAPGETITKVTAHVSQSSGTAPHNIALNHAGNGVYYGTIPARLFNGSTAFRYYLDAHTASGEWTEGPWATVKVVGDASARTVIPPPKKSGIKRPLMIIGGGAALVAGGVALSGGGGGGGGDSDDSDSGSGITIPNTVTIPRTTSDSASGAMLTLPKETIVEATTEIADRSIDRIQIRLNFDPVDTGAEVYEVMYAGSVVMSGTASEAVTEDVTVLGSTTSEVTIRVVSSLEGTDGTFAYSWSAVVNYSVEP